MLQASASPSGRTSSHPSQVSCAACAHGHWTSLAGIWKTQELALGGKCRYNLALVWGLMDLAEAHSQQGWEELLQGWEAGVAGTMGMKGEATHSHMSPGREQVLGCYRILERAMGLLAMMAEVLHGHMTLLGLELRGRRSGLDQLRVP